MMVFRGGSIPNLSVMTAVASIIDLLGLGLKQHQETKMVQMIHNPLMYLQSRNAAYTAIAASAGNA